MLQLHNTLTRKKEALTPLDEANVRMYVCGPTVYDRPHLGNARSVVVYDVLYRLLSHIYGKENITYVRNITDVDDKINARAKERGITIQALTSEVTKQFHEDMGALNCLAPTHEPRATAHIPTMIALTEQLIANGHAYVAKGHVLFDVPSYKEYGKLSGRVQEDLVAGARIEVESYKKNASDFVLWKPADAEDDPSSVFDSPWGKGRPGWHIECSAMSMTYLGEDFDIHGGGSDLMFPHHENEIAQSCCATPGSSFARLWVHNGFLTVNGEKMSKSLGNFVTVKDLLDKGIKGEVIRFALLSAHYRTPLDWTEKLLSDAQKSMNSFYRALDGFSENSNIEINSIGAEIGESFMSHFIKNYMSDDLNMSTAIGYLHEIVKTINTAAHGEKAGQQAQLKAAGNMLGLLQQSPESWFKGAEVEDSVQEQIDARTAAKKAKNWPEADRIRKELAGQGILLEDRPNGTTDWRRA